MELTALKITKKSDPQDTIFYNDLKKWLYAVDEFCLPRPIKSILLNTESVGKILEYKVVDNKEFYIIYIKNLFRKIQSHKKKMRILREELENNFQLIPFEDGGLSDKDILISISLREVRRRVRGEAGILLEREENPLLYEIHQIVSQSLKVNGHTEEIEEEHNTRLLESYFLSRIVNDDLTDNLIKEVIKI